MTLKGERQLMARLNAIGRTETLMRTISIQGVVEAKGIARAFRKTGTLEARIRTGNISALRAEIRAGGSKRDGYARYVEFGTGIYGPHHRRIVPRKAKVLAWRTGPGGAGGPQLTLAGRTRIRKGVELAGWAFAKSVSGRPATPFLRPGLQKAVDMAGVTGIVKLWNGAA